MDLYILFSVFTVMYSWIICTVQSAPVGETPTQGRHVRTKRCSCSSFQDKECVYFCHLDIIWVNTPERVVSYGLGSAPRTRRAVPDSMATSGGARCKCRREGDSMCENFCSPGSYSSRYAALPGAAIRSARGKHELAADTSRIKRMRKSNKKRVSPLTLKTALKTRLLLEKWRVRCHNRARPWDGESAAP